MPPITPQPSPAHVVRQRFIAQTETNLWRSLSVPHQSDAQLGPSEASHLHIWAWASGLQIFHHITAATRNAGVEFCQAVICHCTELMPIFSGGRNVNVVQVCCKVAYFESLNSCFVLCSKPLLCVQHNKGGCSSVLMLTIPRPSSSCCCCGLPI